MAWGADSLHSNINLLVASVTLEQRSLHTGSTFWQEQISIEFTGVIENSVDVGVTPTKILTSNLLR